MTAEKIENIQLLFQKRNAKARGPQSSDQYNSNMNEIGYDLLSFQTQWNNNLVPLIDTLPYDSGTDLLDAFNDGLSGKTMYVREDATAIEYSTYYNSIYDRPNSIYEQFVAVYTAVSGIQTYVDNEIAAIIPTASQISIVDTGSLYTATNVETALAEAMNKINAVDLTFSSVEEDYIPATSSTYDIGTVSQKIRDLYIGRSLLVGVMTTVERDALLANNGMLIYNTDINKFQGYAGGSWTSLH